VRHSLANGDLIFTGTPEGVGATRGKFLVDGDVMTTRIDGIGAQSAERRNSMATNTAFSDMALNGDNQWH